MIATCIAMPASAQKQQSGYMLRKQEIQNRVSQHKAERYVDYSLFDKMIPKTKDLTSPFKQVMTSYGAPAYPKSPILTARPAELWGTYINDIYGNLVSFAPAAPISFNLLKELGYQVAFNGGSALIGEKLYGMSATTMAGIKMKDLYIIDTNTWTAEKEDGTPIYTNNLLATETAKDPTSNKVFGQFFTEDMKGLEWGFIDYTTLTRTAIKASSHRYVALGYAKGNVVYGVATDGNLYKVNPDNGEETLVGATGVKVAKATGEYYEQSGEIDPVSGVFYWAATDANEASKLYTVNLETGVATEISELSNAITGMAIPGAAAADGAPSQVTNVAYNFVNESLTGKISFTAPSTTYSGDKLATDKPLKYTIYANGKKVAEGKVLPGAVAEANVTVSENGMATFKIVTSNEVGEGVKFTENHWIGFDKLAEPSNLLLTKDNAGHVKLTWTAPTTGENGGYIGTITYNVFRVKNGNEEAVSMGQSGLSFEETLEASEYSQYQYVVEAVNGNFIGNYALSESFFFGKAYEPNYVETFDTENNAAPFAKINKIANGYNIWEWDAVGQRMKCASLIGRSDSWLISPPIHLTAGYTYFIKYDVTVPAGTEEKLEVKWGKDVNSDDEKLTNQLLPVTTYKEKSNTTKTYEQEITVGPDGNYSFGFHALSASGSYYVAVDNFKVELGPLPTAPNVVTNLKAEAEPSGLDQAIISFNAPLVNRKGEPITQLDSIVVMSGERRVGKLEKPEVGKAYTVTDLAAEHGNNSYTIVAYNQNGIGQRASVEVNVGQDKPGKIKNITAIDEIPSLKLTWEAPEAANGGILNPAGIEYQVYNVSLTEGLTDEIGTTAKGVTEFVIPDFKTNEGPQDIKYWAVIPRNASGSAEYAIKAVLVGKPYQMPYTRSFPNGTQGDQFLASIAKSGQDAWVLSKLDASDGDGGCVRFNPTQDGAADILMLGKISLRGAVKPQLIFDYKCTPKANRKLIVMATPTNGKPVALFKKDFATSTEDEGWHRATVAIDPSLTECGYIDLKLMAVAGKPVGNEAAIGVDNIHFIDPLAIDAQVELNAPETAQKGHKVTVNAKVTNMGKQDLDANTIVKVYMNGNEIGQKKLTKKLTTTDFEIVPVTYQTSLQDNATTLNVKAEVVAPNDVDKRNDIAEAAIAFNKTDMPKPENVRATGNNTPVVGLTWNAPTIETPTVTEDFESYTPWDTKMGDWTLIDRDHGLALSPDPKPDNFDFPQRGAEFAFTVCQPADYPDNSMGKAIDPHSGNKYATAVYQAIVEPGKKPKLANADNWMISPILPGKAQTVTMWVKCLLGQSKKGNLIGKESFDMLYSTESNPLKIRKFVKIGDTYVIDKSGWQEVKFEVPEGARYFAIHHNTTAMQTWMFMIDDIHFVKGNLPYCYNIYRDGIFIGTTKTLDYTDGKPGADGNHKYSVAAVYADGSVSDPVDVEVVTDIIAIEALNADKFNVYTLDGVQVLKDATSLKNLKRGVYIVNGKKVMINN